MVAQANDTRTINKNTINEKEKNDSSTLPCESKKVAPLKLFCDIFTCGEPV